MHHRIKLLALSFSGLGFAFACGSSADDGVTPDDVGTRDASVDRGTTTDAGGFADGAPADARVDADAEEEPFVDEPDTPNPAATRKVKDLTGAGTSSAQFKVGGTDLGIPVRQPNGKIAYIFGDTFEQDGVYGPGWRSPVLLRSNRGRPTNGIVFNSAAGGQHAKQLFDYQHDTADWSTWLPTDAITIGSRMYLHYTVNKGLGNVRWSQIAYSDDNGENWTLSNARWEGNEDGDLRQLWTWERGLDGFVYVMSTKFITRDRGIIMYRVPENKILDRTAYVPWGFRNNQWGWGNPPSIILDGRFGELCLRRVQNKWVLSAFDAGNYNIMIKVFDGPTSNLITATTYTPIVGGATEDHRTVNQLYGGYIHPDSTLHNLHLIISQWATSAPNGWPYRAMQFITGVE